MLKIIALILMVVGIALLAYTFITGIKKNIRGIRNEYEMILSSGYVSEHVAAPARESIYKGETPDAPVMAAPRKRVLSKEGLDLLERVESQRNEERLADSPVQVRKVQAETPATEIPRENETSALAENMATSTLAKAGRAKKDSTSVLTEKKTPARKDGGTSTLKEEAKSGTSTLTEEKSNGTSTLTPEKTDSGTSTLTAEKKSGGTSTLNEKNGAVPTLSDGTGVLNGPKAESSKTAPAAKNSGTSVLTPKAEKTTGTGTLEQEISLGNGTGVLDPDNLLL